jgi:ketosteroid isomerase-like protein
MVAVCIGLIACDSYFRRGNDPAQCLNLSKAGFPLTSSGIEKLYRYRKGDIMSKMVAILLMSALLVVLPGSLGEAQGAEDGAAFAVEAVYDAVTAGDIDGALDYLADDAVLVILPAPVGQDDAAFVGKDEIRSWFEGLHADNGRAEYSDIRIDGDRCTWTAKWWSDMFESMGVAPAEFEGVAVIQDDTVKSMTWSWTKEFEDRFNRAMTLQANEALGHRYIEEMWNNGNMEATDEMLADDFVDIYPKPGFEPDKAGIMADAAGFHEMGLYDRVDQVIATEDAIAIQVTVFGPTDDGGQVELGVAFILLDVEDGKITSRRVGFPGW